MFCPKCGQRADDDAVFCASCGLSLVAVASRRRQQMPSTPAPRQQPVTSPSSTPVVNHPPVGLAHPEYQQMGGWLLAFMIIYIIGGVWGIFQGLSVFWFTASLSSMAASFGAGGLMGILYFSGLFIIGSCAALLYFVYLVFNKQDSFLRYFQILVIAYMISCALLVFVLMSSFSSMLSSLIDFRSLSGGITGGLTMGTIASMAVVFVAMLLLWTTYYCKSERVQTYMGSRAYLQQALFTLGV